jgi:hypothetical protein
MYRRGLTAVGGKIQQNGVEIEDVLKEEQKHLSNDVVLRERFAIFFETGQDQLNLAQRLDDFLESCSQRTGCLQNELEGSLIQVSCSTLEPLNTGGRVYPYQTQQVRFDLDKGINHAAIVLEHGDKRLDPGETPKGFCLGLLLLDGERRINHVIGSSDSGEVESCFVRQTSEELLFCREKGLFDPR